MSGLFNRRRNLLFIILFMFLTFFASGRESDAMQNEAPLPWKVGEKLGDSYSISQIKRFDEFLLLDISEGEKTYHAEIGCSDKSQAGEFSTVFYRIQPQPGCELEEGVILALKSNLLAWESRTDHQPFVMKVRRQPQMAMAEALTENQTFSASVVIYGYTIASAVFLAAAILLRFSRSKSVLILKRRIYILAFSLLTLFPIVLFLCLFFEAGLTVMRIETISLWPSVLKMEQEMENREGLDFSFTEVGGQDGYYAYQGDSRNDYSENKPYLFIPFQPEENDPVTYIFGGSSVAFQHEISPDNISVYLQGYLGAKSNEKHRVYNFAMGGLDSFSVKKRVAVSVQRHKPDLIIIYSGHNDFSNAYKTCRYASGLALLKNGMLSDRVLQLMFYLSRIIRLQTATGMPYEVWKKGTIEPRLFSFLAQSGFLKIKYNQLEYLNRVIVKYFKRNMESIISLAAGKSIPVVLVTPVFNLHVQLNPMTEQMENLYLGGLTEPDYNKRIEMLTRAKDHDVFSREIRAKTMLLEEIRSMARPGVFVFDLENDLKKTGFEFSDEEFAHNDYVHFNNHHLIAQKLYNFIREQNIFSASAHSVTSGSSSPSESASPPASESISPSGSMHRQ